MWLISLASFLPAPYSAIYAATKAFVFSFSAALWAEYRQRGILVLALCLGLVETGFFTAAGSPPPTGSPASSPHVVVAAALKGLERGKIYVVAGRMNYVVANFAKRLLPLSTVSLMVANMIRPKPAEK